MSEVPDTGPEAPDVHDRVPPQTAAAWKQGEERLYLAALTDVGLYQRVLAPGAHHRRPPARPWFRHAGTAGRGRAGCGARRRWPRVAKAGALSGRRPTSSPRPRSRCGTASCVAEQVGRRRLAALDDARGRGETWAVLEESGEPAGDPFLPYRRLEVDVATGRALLVSATPDDEFGRCRAHRRARCGSISGPAAVRELDDGSVAADVLRRTNARRARSAARAWEALTGLAHLPDVHHSE